MKEVLEGLTQSQAEAVTHGDGPLLGVAGAGSGKTRVITRRVAYLAASGVPPYRILAITFTNKAADEMKRRVAELTGTRGAWISTFHSMCARMLRQFPDLLGFEYPFSIYDRADSLACIKAVLSELGLAGSRMKPNSFLGAISRAKNNMLTPAQYAERASSPREKQTARVYDLYQRMCRANSALDFDDLLLCAAQLMEENDSFRTYWQGRFSHVLIDEYQDTNHPQYVIARWLAAGHGNLCATGDPDQSIYGWRGADIKNILDFKKDYSDARLVKLEENFRSTKTILLAASGVIEINKERIERGLWTRNDKGTPVQVIESATDVDEADAVVAGIKSSRADGFNYADMAVFYRTHAQSRVVEDSLRDAGMPYLILDAVEFYNRKEVKDVVAYLKAIVNPSDAVSLLRIINEPRRGIGPRTVERLQAHAAAERLTFDEALGAADDIPALSKGAARKLKDFAALMGRLRGTARSPVVEVVRAVLAETGYLEILKQSAAEEDAARAENVEELVNAAAQFDLDYPEAGLEEFLERVTLVSDSDAMTSDEGRVLLMTLHSAKGLEFPVVFIVGVQEGLLPHINALGSKSQVEEERRLCYVGMTRAKKKLFLHWAAERFTFGQCDTANQSRFIAEIPAEAKQHESQSVKRVIEYDEEVTGDEPDRLSVNDRVRHPVFGTGRVVSVSGSGAKATVVVDFRGRKRHLMLKFANLVQVG